MRFTLILHSHMPWVLHHGRWPHGSDWLAEAALDTYLPLLAWLERAATEDSPVGLTLGVTPILAAQLAHPSFVSEVDAYFAHRFETLAESETSLHGTGDPDLIPLIAFWTDHLTRLQALWQRLDRDIIGALRHHAAAGRIELISSAATHGFLPLLARDESIRFQLLLGRAEHLRHFGVLPKGCWVPECAYRPAGPWQPWPTIAAIPDRVGVETHLRYAGFRWFVVDAHLAHAGAAWELYEAEAKRPLDATNDVSPYRSFEVGARPTGARAVDVVIRDPETTAQVWSRHGGYPGDSRYLEFHKIRYPGGLKLWRVTDPAADLGAKAPYDPIAAHDAARLHAAHFQDVLHRIAATATENETAIVAPFDTELFGHWWFEGIDFLAELYRHLAENDAVTASTGSALLTAIPPDAMINLEPGSWGANGDFSKWLNDETAWMWERLWPLEHRFWDAIPATVGEPHLASIVEQAARELLLAQSSDWQFIVSTGAAGDYATKRFIEHCDALESLLPALEGWGDVLHARYLAEELHRIDDPFPSLLGALAAASDLPAR